MRRSTWLVAMGAALAVVAGQAIAAETTQLNSQQERMKNCNAEAKAEGKKGDDRKAFMKSCLSNESAAAQAKGNSQQERMKRCNEQNKGKKGDDYKSSMKSCLSDSK